MSDQPDSKPLLRQPAGTSNGRGRLTIFFGMAPGVGKTCAMLASAERDRLAGRDIVIACVETHGNPMAEQLCRTLAKVPGLPTRKEGVDEMDLDGVLARRPQIAVVDDLAHLNAPGRRHQRRYQDVSELLDAGIDVYTTLNVHNVASRTDAVSHITGAEIFDIVPDTLLSGAEIELVDVLPEKLLKRLERESVHFWKNPHLTKSDFFQVANLTALREMTLRLVAETVGRDVGRQMQLRQIAGPWKSGHRLLVGVGPGQASEQTVRWARRLADSLNCPWLALYVETPRGLAKAEQSRVTRNLALARELGAEVMTTSDSDLVRGLLRVAFQRNITQIVVGKPSGGPLVEVFRRQLRLRRLLRDSDQIDIHVVRAQPVRERSSFPPWPRFVRPELRQYLKAATVVSLVTALNYVLSPVIGVHAAALIFLLAVVGLGLFVPRGATLLAAAMSAIVWDYFFLPPVFAFRVGSFEDGMLLAMYFIVAIVLGQLTARNRAQEATERQREARSTALYLLTRELSEAINLEEILHKAIQQTERAFNAHAGIRLADGPHAMNQRFFPPNLLEIAEKEQALSAWVLKNGQPAGKFSETMEASDVLYLPLTMGERALGVLALRLSQAFEPTIHQRNLLDAFCQQIAMALDRHRLQHESERTKLLAESERLSKTLLNSMSHEIRTPLAAIKSATGNLVEFQETPWSAPQQAMIGEIQEATERLNRLVGNVLDATRLESGHVKPKLSLCDVRDLLQVVVRDTRKDLAKHQFSLEVAPDLPLVRMDFVLMQQVVANLLSNAAFHTPAGTAVRLKAWAIGNSLEISVTDDGPGIPEGSLPRVFEKFYRAPSARAGGTGLGLSLVKGFVEAQGGQVAAGNGPSGGATFTVRLPLEKSAEIRALART